MVLHWPHQYVAYLLAAYGFVLAVFLSAWCWMRWAHRRWREQMRLMRHR